MSGLESPKSGSSAAFDAQHRRLHALGLPETRGRAGSYSPRPLDARPLPIEKLRPLACRDYGRSGSPFAQQEGAPVLSGGLRAGPPGSKEGALFELDTCALLRLKGRRARGGGEKRVEETCSARTQEGLS